MHLCMHSGNPSILQVLLNSGMDFGARDANGYTPFDYLNKTPPIHNMVVGQSPTDATVVETRKAMREMFLKHFSKFVMKQNGDLGLHWLLGSAEYSDKGQQNAKCLLGTLNVQQMLLLLTLFESRNPNFFSSTDTDGATPLHVACSCPGTPRNVIQFLLDKAPAAIQLPDVQGNLPLHVLSVTKPSLNVSSACWMLGTRPCPSATARVFCPLWWRARKTRHWM